MDIPSDSLLKGICNGNEKYIMVTWRSKSDHLINNSVSLNLTVNNGVHYINAAQINISDVNPLNNIRSKYLRNHRNFFVITLIFSFIIYGKKGGIYP